MIIAIPVEEKNLEAAIYTSFARAPYFLIYDTERKESVFIDNNAVTSVGGAGIKAAQTIADNKVDFLLTPRCGENANDVLKASGIKVCKTNGVSLGENISKFITGELDILEEIHSGFHKYGGN